MDSNVCYFIISFKNHCLCSITSIKKNNLSESSSFEVINDLSFYNQNTSFSKEDIDTLIFDGYLGVPNQDYSILLDENDLKTITKYFDLKDVASFLADIQKSKQPLYFKTKEDFLNLIISGLTVIKQKNKQTPQVDLNKVTLTTKSLLEELNLPPISVIVKNIEENVIGQNEAIKKAVLAIYRNLHMASMDYSLSKRIALKNNILISGPSGCGKSEITRQLAHEFQIPMYTVDISQFTGSGWKGNDLIELLKGLYLASGKNLEMAQKGILNLDEIDKISFDSENAHSSSHNTIEVQKELLKIIEGGTFDLKPTTSEAFDTSTVTIIGTGAFNGSGRNYNCPSTDNGYFTENDYIKYGLIPEFVGRFKSFITINNLSFADKRRYLLTSKLSLLKLKFEELNRLGIKISIINGLDKLIDEIIRLSEEMNEESGIRNINKVAERIFEEIDYRLFDDEELPKEIIFSEEIVRNPQKVMIRKK